MRESMLSFPQTDLFMSNDAFLLESIGVSGVGGVFTQKDLRKGSIYLTCLNDKNPSALPL